MTLLRGALGAALLAMPLAGAAGQSASQHDPSARAASDSSGGHQLAWVVGAGAAGGALFTSFVRLSERGATVDAERGLTFHLPASPVPNHYTDGTLPGSGVSPGQNTPLPGKTPPPGQDTSASSDPQQTGVGGDQTGQQPPSGNQLGSVGIVVTTPEPESIFLLGTGFVALLPAVRRRRPGS